MPPHNQIRADQRPPQREKIFDALNIFDYDKSKVPGGVTYEWKRVRLAGMEDPDNLILAEQNGWEPVPSSRHPELAGKALAKERPDAPIIKRGLMLMELPIAWHEQSTEMDQFKAQNTLEEQIQRLGLQARQNGGRGVKRTRGDVDLPITRRRSGEGELVE